MENPSFETDFLVQRRQALFGRYGPEAESIRGLLDHLATTKGEVVSLAVNLSKGLAAYTLDRHEDRGAGAIEMRSIVGVYRNGKSEEKSFVYRNTANSKQNDISSDFGKVELYAIDSDGKVEVKAYPKDARFAPKVICF